MGARSFRIVHPKDPRRVIRGAIDLPEGDPPSPRGWPHAVIFHGFKGFMDWGFFPDIARRLARAGVAAVRFNASGSGVGEDLLSFGDLESFERNTISKELEDVALVRSFVREGGALELDPAKNVGIGHSRGGGIVLLHAAESGDALGVVTWAAVASFDRFDAEAKERWRRDGFLSILNARTGQEMRLGLEALEDLERNRARFDLPAAARRVRCPVLLVHGTEDETVPVEESELLAAALGPAKASLLAIEGAGHTFGVRHPMEVATAAWETVAEATTRRVGDFLI
jgi:dienelactone hydrolase